MRKLDPAAVQRFLEDPDQPDHLKRELRERVASQRETLEANPLQGFWPHTCLKCDRYGSDGTCTDHRTPQLDFLKSKTRITAAFSGNRFGKTTALIVWILCQHAPLELLPRHLRNFKQTDPKKPVMGRLLCPSDDAMIEYVIPALKQWCPRVLMRGGNWDKAWSKQHSILYFREGCGQLSVYTYKQDPSVMVGAALNYVAYDEPPPEAHRKECLIRVGDSVLMERFALTPVNMVGGGIGWLYRKIWKRRNEPHITVVKGSSFENRHLSAEAIEAALSEYDEKERPAREHGDFLHMGGMVYDNGFEGCLVDRPSVDHVLGLEEYLVGIDPGMVNAAFIWEGFDKDDVCIVFDELLLENQTPADYQLAIALTNARWGLGGREERNVALGTLKELRERGLISLEEWEQKTETLLGPMGPEPVYVIDPSARNRGLLDAEATVESELARLGIYCIRGQNNVEGGCQQVRRRIQFGKWLVSRDCRGLRAEAEEYRKEDREDGEFKVVKENDHRLDASRYPAMHRPLRREFLERKPRARSMNESWRPPVKAEESGPLGSFV